MKRTSFAVVSAMLALTIVATQAAPASALPDQVAQRGVAWLLTRQQADGSYEVSGFPGFETPDAILAIAESAQTRPGWDAPAALSAVKARSVNGKTALDAIDDFVDAGVNAAQAAKLITLVAAPLGLSSTDFDPSNDTAAPVNLQATLAAASGADQSYPSLAFSGRLYAALAMRVLGATVPPGLINAIRAAQQADGSWNYKGSPAPAAFDPDTTGLAIQALVAGGSTITDPAVAKGLKAFARNQQRSGAFAAFGSDDPNSTSVAILAITAAGGDVGDACWRDLADPTRTDLGYTSPLGWLESRQAGDGHILSPNDATGVNTFATTQAVQAISRDWLPVASAAPLDCSDVAPPGASAQAFVKAAYVDILGRPADARGLASAVARLAGGATHRSVAHTLTSSSEYRTHVVTGLFHDYLDRAPTALELSTDVDLIRSGHRTGLQIALLASPAYFAAAGSDDAKFVAAVYRDVLGREVDSAGSARWVAALHAGTSRLAVARALVTSGEARSHVVRDLYLSYLHRTGDAAGVAYWRGRLGHGTSIEAVIESLVGSVEYTVRANAAA